MSSRAIEQAELEIIWGEIQELAEKLTRAGYGKVRFVKEEKKDKDNAED